MMGMHIAIKNFSLLKEYQTKGVGKVSRGDKIGLFVAPLFCFIGGSINLYLAIDILKNYQKEREMWRVMNEEGLFEG